MKNSKLRHISHYVFAFLIVISASVGCAEKKENKKDSQKEYKRTEKTKVAKVEVTLKISGEEAINVIVSDKSVLEFKVGKKLYGVAVSNLDINKKEATLALVAVDDLKENIKVIPKDKLTVLNEKQGTASLSVDRVSSTFDIQLNNFSIEEVDEKAKSKKCCVTCDNITACGCAVTASCDSCCVDPCCQKSLPNSVGTVLPEINYFDTLK